MNTAITKMILKSYSIYIQGADESNLFFIEQIPESMLKQINITKLIWKCLLEIPNTILRNILFFILEWSYRSFLRADEENLIFLETQIRLYPVRALEIFKDSIIKKCRQHINAIYTFFKNIQIQFFPSQEDLRRAKDWEDLLNDEYYDSVRYEVDQP